MMPTYSYTEYTSPSGNTQIYVVRQKKNTLNKISERRKYIQKQRFLGISLVILGVIACAVFPEDATGGVFVTLMGIANIFGCR